MNDLNKRLDIRFLVGLDWNVITWALYNSTKENSVIIIGWFCLGKKLWTMRVFRSYDDGFFLWLINLLPFENELQLEDLFFFCWRGGGKEPQVSIGRLHLRRVVFCEAQKLGSWCLIMGSSLGRFVTRTTFKLAED